MKGNTPSSMGWFGRILLTYIPVIGVILLLVWAFGGTSCPAVKTWARAQFLFVLIPMVIVFILFLTGTLDWNSFIHSVK